MIHVNNLPSVILRRILYTTVSAPVSRLSAWKRRLPLLAVCRVWADLTQPFVFNHVFVEFVQACASEESPANNGACIAWNSNADLFISRHCTLMARRLTMGMTDFATPNDTHYIAFNILRLDHVDWMYVNTLTIIGNLRGCEHSAEPVSLDDQAKAEVAHAVQYFAQKMRGIFKLNMGYTRFGTARDHLCANFMTCYGGQLQILRGRGPIPLSFTHFSRNISVLDITLDSGASCLLPGICGETLQILRIDNVPRNFAWHHFRYDVFSRPIVFRRLVILRIAYETDFVLPAEEDVQRKAALGAHNCDQLCFPVLKQLAISHCTPDCDLLYADTPFLELKKVHLDGSFEDVRHCNRLKIAWAGDFVLEITTFRSGPTKDFYSVANHLFTDICTGRTAALVLHSNEITIDPELVRWANLTYLRIARISYETLCKLVSRLPNLTDFQTYRLGFDSLPINDAFENKSLFCSPDPLMPWGAKLAAISIIQLSEGSPVAVAVRSIWTLILHAAALRELALPDEVEPHVNPFIDANVGRYPHLAYIFVGK